MAWIYWSRLLFLALAGLTVCWLAWLAWEFER